MQPLGAPAPELNPTGPGASLPPHPLDPRDDRAAPHAPQASLPQQGLLPLSLAPFLRSSGSLGAAFIQTQPPASPSWVLDQSRGPARRSLPELPHAASGPRQAGTGQLAKVTGQPCPPALLPPVPRLPPDHPEHLTTAE